jgi:hypothetical protein
MPRPKRLVVKVHRLSLWQIVGIYLGRALLAYGTMRGIMEAPGLPERFPKVCL